MKQPFPWAETIILSLAVASLLLITYANARRQAAQAPRYDTFSSYDAHTGGYRAWYELLQREGIHVTRFERRPAFLDDSIGTLIASANTMETVLRGQATGDVTGSLQAIDIENLKRWVQAGGRLVWVSDGSSDEPLVQTSLIDSGQQRDDAVPLARAPVTQDVTSVSGPGQRRVAYGANARLEPLIGDGSGAVVADYPLGKGRIIVVTDQNLFDNKHIAAAGNAQLALNLATGGPRGSVAFFEWVHGYAAGGSWWTILPMPVRAAVIIVLVAALLLLVGTALRFGPTARLPEDAERTSAEYLSSMAQLLARGKAARKAIGDLAAVTLRDVATALGLTERATVAELVTRLSFGQDGEARVEQLRELDRIRALAHPSDADLIRAAQICALLRKEYTRYGRIGFGRRPAPLRRSA